MCRRKHLNGCCMISFGAGLLAGGWLKSGFLCCLGGFGLLILGGLILRRK